jgi:hypothetical protein
VVIAMAASDVVSQTVQFLIDLVKATLWKFFLLLPWTLITSVAALQAVAGPGQHLANLEQPSVTIQWFALILWMSFFAVAGVLWGVHRALYEGLNDGIRLCQQRGAEAAGALLDPVLARLPVGKAEYPLDVVRQQWTASTSELVFRHPNPHWYSPVARLTNWLARKWVNVQTAVVTQTLDELQAFGEKAVSAASLKRFVVHRSATAMADVARSKLRFWSFVTAGIVFLLLVTPAALTTTITLLTRNG